ncbi:MAG: TIGR04141 family sporadically distributed protein [Candidatus Paracaedibacteraceae bacterium]|nr:TIGR04141 family sporadically distributed protein [Candidatus Paracaedibacteraceae bacterium]
MRYIKFRVIILASIMQLIGQQQGLAAEKEAEMLGSEEIISSPVPAAEGEEKSDFDQALEAFMEEENDQGRKRSSSISKSSSTDSQVSKKQKTSQKSSFKVALIKAGITSYEEIIRNYNNIIKREDKSGPSANDHENELPEDELNLEVLESEDIENSEVILTRHAIKDGIIFLKRERVRAAPWVHDILEHIATNGEEEVLPLPISGNADKIDSAIICIEANGRKFAIPLGNGYRLLNPESIEQDFGLKVALNAVDTSKIRELGSQTISYNPRATLTTYSMPVDLNQFAVDANSLVKTISADVANPTDGITYRMASYGAYVQVGRKLEINRLHDLCLDLLGYGQKKDYKRKFPWIKNIRPITEKETIVNLQKCLLSAIKGETSETWYFSNPWSNDGTSRDYSISTYYKINSAKKRYTNLEEVADYLRDLASKGKFSIKKIKAHRVFAVDEDTNETISEWNMYKGITFETAQKKARYVLHEGMWFMLALDYVAEIDGYIECICLPDNERLSLPAKGPKQKEGPYNASVASNDDSFLLFDQRIVAPSTHTNATPIEVCDLLTKQKHLVHIKDGTDSSVLSHLFAQGSVSAITLKRDNGFRLGIKDKYVRAEILDLLEGKTAAEFGKLEKLWLQLAQKHNDWASKMKGLLSLDAKMLGNFKKGKGLTEAKIKKLVSLKKNASLTDALIFTGYKNHLFKTLGKKFADACKLDFSMDQEERDQKICEDFIKISVNVLGKKLVTDSLMEEIKRNYGTNQILVSQLIPFEQSQFKPSDYQIVYGIITNKTGAMGEILPFFSRVNLKEHATRIINEGYKVGVQKIGIVQM